MPWRPIRVGPGRPWCWAPVTGRRVCSGKVPFRGEARKKIQIDLQLVGLNPIILPNSANWDFNLEVAVASR